ncbi:MULTISPECIES: serine hydrolase domain-containing protein [Kitasatospora]|uniref:Putative beta-lactamase n=1 Tax=Kitasatospora setae (strain ATCC 33774 / DSM 43861 / JCM 3304 / KCC A-0304 / NBRC 14216 / KM-6054) TaxID=452652 RepID=E4NE71_KITSK|nr:MULTISPECIES: serine hydrolase domain-containing protein [Kitasatospora]BAJ29502.1 putative beta-lactamase [Kitasatospora setae KM-6054]
MGARTTGRRLAATAAIGALVVALTAGAAGAAPVAGHRGGPDAAALRASIADLSGAGATSAVVLADGEGGRWSGTSGTGDPATGRPVKADGRFRIGSISKVFTATVLLQLAAEHRIDLDGTVQHYLPDALPAGYPPVTVRQLLNHTSGLPGGDGLLAPDGSADDGGAAWFAAHAADRWTPRQVLDTLAGEPMGFAPGTAQQYNGVNYFLAGLLVERVTGRSFEREVTERVLRPLGLRRTSVPAATDTALPDPSAHAVLAVPRAGGGSDLVDVTRQSPWPWAEGGMVSTAPDLDRFLSALLRGELLPPAQQAELFAVPDVPNFRNKNCDLGPTAGRACFSTGLMRFTPAPGVELWGKTGSRPGYTSAVFATRDASRELVYSFTPTSRQGVPFPDQYRVAAAAFDLPAL